MKLKSGKFELIIDEPTYMGGIDVRPSPIQVLLMSLAGCINVTGNIRESTKINVTGN